MMAKINNSVKRIVTWCSIAALLLTLGGILLAVGGQNQKLEAACGEQVNIGTKVNTNEKDIVELKNNVSWIREGVGELKEQQHSLGEQQQSMVEEQRSMVGILERIEQKME